MRRIPPYAQTDDWPRAIATAVNALIGRTDTLEARFSDLGDYTDDTAAASGGVEVGGLYRTGSAIKVRVS